MMTPAEYVNEYHEFSVNDPLMGLSFQTIIKGYNSTYPEKGDAEFWKVMGAITQKYFGTSNTMGFCKTNERFWIPNEPRVNPGEDFSPGSLRRAFVSRGSPDEFRDAVRMAFLAGRCNATNAAAYARTWFTNDCVSFAGNYVGVSPNTPVFAYPQGWAGVKDLKGDVVVSKDLVHLPLRDNPAMISEGDVLCSFGFPDKRGIQWRHIAIVSSFGVNSDTTGLVQGAVGSGVLSLAEWGSADAASHTHTGKVTLHDGSLCPDSKLLSNFKGIKRFLRGSKVIAYNGTITDKIKDAKTQEEKPVTRGALRVFLDGSSLKANFAQRGWHIGDRYPVPW
jgi:hypothetical protein